MFEKNKEDKLHKIERTSLSEFVGFAPAIRRPRQVLYTKKDCVTNP